MTKLNFSSFRYFLIYFPLFSDVSCHRGLLACWQPLLTTCYLLQYVEELTTEKNYNTLLSRLRTICVLLLATIMRANVYKLLCIIIFNKFISNN